MIERELQDSVLRLATMQGWTLRYHTFDSRRSQRGFPDLVLVRKPRVLFVELKSEKGRVTAEQWAWLDGLANCPGVEAHLWRPSHWPDEIQRVLAR